MVQHRANAQLAAVSGCVYVNYFGFSIAVFAFIFPLIKNTYNILYVKPQANIVTD